MAHKSKIYDAVMKGRTSAQQSKIKQGFKSVKQNKDFLFFMLTRGADLEHDLSQVFLDCQVMRGTNNCDGCPIWQPALCGGCLWFDKWAKEAEQFVPEDVQEFLHKHDDESVDDLIKKLEALKNETVVK